MSAAYQATIALVILLGLLALATPTMPAAYSSPPALRRTATPFMTMTPRAYQGERMYAPISLRAPATPTPKGE